ncbi:MAG: GNAT family N-acetyltransferase [Cellvibrio sp.]|nr:GNAT family N-acetyltransferase [Cellvibrio sp.]
MNISIQQADYHNPEDAQAIVNLLDAYARDLMGGGEPLSQFVKDNLIVELAKRSFAVSLIAFADTKPVGLLNAFEGFSTFKAKPLINIHDIIVLSEYRGRQIGKKLLLAIEAIAREKNCCKITLEVLEGNQAAQKVYRKAGFAGYALDPEMGHALFWQKNL